MLKKFKVRNFYSVGAEQEVSFEIGNKETFDNSARRLDSGKSINLVNCFIGHNASGKTTILKAITFVFWFIRSSYDLKASRSIPFEPHKLHKDETTSFELDFVANGVSYRYELEITRTQVLTERLRMKKERYNNVFDVDRRSGSDNIKFPMLKVNKNDKKRFLDRRNVSVFSSLIRTGYLEGFDFIDNGTGNVSQLGYLGGNYMGDFFEVSEMLSEDEDLRKEVLNFCQSVDLSISEFGFGKTTVRVVGDGGSEEEEREILQCVHKSADGSKQFTLDLIEESNGTHHGISIAAKVLSVLRIGGIVVLDEIDDGLHPLVVKKIISLFESPETNPNCAQLYFSTHLHLLMNDRTKTQIFICQKDGRSFETDVYRLDDVEGVRNDENFFQKYLAGEYGGAPDIKWI